MQNVLARLTKRRGVRARSYRVKNHKIPLSSTAGHKCHSLPVFPEAVLTVPGMRSNVSLEVQIPSAAHAVWLKVNAGAEELPDARYLVLHNPSNFFIYFFVCVLLWNAMCHLLPVARLASHGWPAAACSVITGIRQILLKYLFIISASISSGRSHEMWSQVIFKIKNLITTKLPQQFI